MRKLLLVGAIIVSSAGFFNNPTYGFASKVCELTQNTFAGEFKGEVGERFAEKFFSKFFTKGSKGKWIPLPSKNGRQGIDNLLVSLDKNGNVKDVLIVEAKVNNSELRDTTTKGFQMSKEWILKSIKERLKKENDPQMKKILMQVKEKVERNQYRARLVKLISQDGKTFRLIISQIPAGTSSSELKSMGKNLKITTNKVISINENSKLGRLLRESISEVCEEFTKLGKAKGLKIPLSENKILKAQTVRKLTAELPFEEKIRTPRISKTLKKIRYLKFAAFAKEGFNIIPVIGIFFGAVAQAAYDAAVADTLERLAKEQEILGKQIAYNRQQIVALAMKQAELAQMVKENQEQITVLSQSVAQVKTQIAEIKRGIFLTGLYDLKEYYTTKDANYLYSALNALIAAKLVKNPQLEPLINFYLINARTEKYKVKPLKGELKLLKEELEALASQTNAKNYNLLLTAYKMVEDIPLNGKEQIVKTAIGRVIGDLLKENKFEDALTVAKSYLTFTGDKSLKQLVETARLENFERYKSIENPLKMEEILNKNQNSLLVKHYAKGLYQSGYYTYAVDILTKHPVNDEKFMYSIIYLSLLHSGETEKASKLLRLILENPTYSTTTKSLIKNLNLKWNETLKQYQQREVSLMF